jgi:antirestriction protein ArdC
MASKVYEIVTAKVLAALEEGNIPWKKPWIAGIPRNAVSNRPYSGINSVLLNLSGYSDPRWITFKQCSAKGGKVGKGQKGSLVIFWKQNTIQTETDTGELTEKTIPLLRYFLVWNIEQTEGLDLPQLETRNIDAVAEAEAILAGMQNPPSISYDGGDRAYYIPARDEIHLPAKSSFLSTSEYYCTAYHEISHATGHESRLNRSTLTDVVPFGSETYSKEELVAEMSAAYLCAHSGIDSTLANSVNYVKGWLKALKNDPKMVVIAASQGQKAANCVMGITD